MNATTEYWEDRLAQEQFEREVEVEALKKRIAELEDALADAKARIAQLADPPYA